MTALRAAVLAACLAVALAGVSRTATTPSTSDRDSGRLPADILCQVYGGAVCEEAKRSNGTAKHRSRRQDQQEGGDLDPATLCSVFGGENCPLDSNKAYKSCACPDGVFGNCECIPYYQCSAESGEANQDGVGLIDIRQQNGCGHYMLQCCKVPNKDGGGGGGDQGGGDGGQGGGDGGQGGGDSPPYVPPKLGPAPLTKPPCGQRNVDGVGTRISGMDSDQAKFGEISWMVAVFRKRDADLEYLCGGGLIAPDVVLTAAHCFNDAQASELAVRAGEWDSRTEDELYKHQDRDVDQLVIHPEYKDRALHNDLALLVLAEPIRVGYHIGTICLPEQNQRFDGRECLVSGWGKDKFDKEGVYANILRRIDDLPVVPHDQCQDRLRGAAGGRLGAYFRLNRSFMCAGGIKGKDACTGDGGSPLVCPTSDDDNARYQFAGIVSWGVGCGEEGVPGVYADVAQHRNWIEQKLSDLNVQVTRDP